MSSLSEERMLVEWVHTRMYASPANSPTDVPLTDPKKHTRHRSSFVNVPPSIKRADPNNRHRQSMSISHSYHNSQGHSKHKEVEQRLRRDFRHGVFFECFQGVFPDIPRELPACAHAVGITYSLKSATELENALCSAQLPETKNLDCIVKLSGYLDLPQHNQYTFFIKGPFRCVLMVRNKRVVDHTGSKTVWESEGVQKMKQGLNSFKLIYLQKREDPTRPAGNRLHLPIVSYYSPGLFWPLKYGSVEKQQIPDTALYHDFNDMEIRKKIGEQYNNLQLVSRKEAAALLSVSELRILLDLADTQIVNLNEEIKKVSEMKDMRINDLSNELISYRKCLSLTLNTLRNLHIHADNPGSEDDARRMEAVKGGKSEFCANNLESICGDTVLNHVADIENLKRNYFFALSLSIKLQQQMCTDSCEKEEVRPTTIPIQDLYEYCIASGQPLQQWPAYVSRHYSYQYPRPPRSALVRASRANSVKKTVRISEC